MICCNNKGCFLGNFVVKKWRMKALLSNRTPLHQAQTTRIKNITQKEVKTQKKPIPYQDNKFKSTSSTKYVIVRAAISSIRPISRKKVTFPLMIIRVSIIPTRKIRHHGEQFISMLSLPWDDHESFSDSLWTRVLLQVHLRGTIAQICMSNLSNSYSL